MSEPIFESIEAADAALPKCPRAHVESGGLHWWYIDGEKEELKERSGGVEEEVVECICKTCGHPMKLSASADEYPAV